MIKPNARYYYCYLFRFYPTNGAYTIMVVIITRVCAPLSTEHAGNLLIDLFFFFVPPCSDGYTIFTPYYYYNYVHVPGFGLKTHN